MLALTIGSNFRGAFGYGDLREMPADELLDLADEVEREVKRMAKEVSSSAETG